MEFVTAFKKEDVLGHVRVTLARSVDPEDRFTLTAKVLALLETAELVLRRVSFSSLEAV